MKNCTYCRILHKHCIFLTACTFSDTPASLEWIDCWWPSSSSWRHATLEKKSWKENDNNICIYVQRQPTLFSTFSDPLLFSFFLLGGGLGGGGGGGEGVVGAKGRGKDLKHNLFWSKMQFASSIVSEQKTHCDHHATLPIKHLKVQTGASSSPQTAQIYMIPLKSYASSIGPNRNFFFNHIVNSSVAKIKLCSASFTCLTYLLILLMRKMDSKS